ncbi:MAG: lamin tail domain-containing protein [Nanoarchaeota archaeon]|nr:hypothetical protein [Nanoarchaeota archaeon]
MWRKNCWCLGIVFLIIIFSLNVSAIRINEVELNPKDDCYDCTEWVELYSENEINLNGLSIKDIDNNTFYLNSTFKNYYIIQNLSISLNNKDEKLFLYNDEELIDETPVLTDSKNNEITWSYCSNGWIFTEQTKEKENFCEKQDENLEEDKSSETQIIKQEEQPEKSDYADTPADNSASKKNSTYSDANYENKIISLNNLKNTKTKISEYKTKTQHIKEYLIYGFAVFCVFIIIVLIIKKF